MFLHIDCNSFFASCEIASNRALEGTPVVVANDNEAGGGIILALNAEAKALGLKRGNPVFQVRSLLKLNHVNVCPADHRKYHSVSSNIMRAVQQQGLVLDFVQYSVDEFFGSMPLDDEQELRLYVGKVKDLIWEETHIPVSCGCADTYTLAKVATHFAKSHKGYHGICVLNEEKRERALSLLPVGEVWGIGRRNQAKLTKMCIVTALDLVHVDEQKIKSIFGVSGLRTWYELRGRACIDLERSAQQKSIMQSRTFAYMTDKKAELNKNIAGYAQACCTSLRHQQSMAAAVTVFIATNPHRADLPQYSNSATQKFRSPTDDTSLVMKEAQKLLDSIFRKGYQYKRAGIILTGITEVEGSQLDLFSAENDERRRKLMKVTDVINQKFGHDAIGFSVTKADNHTPNHPLTYPGDGDEQ